LLLLHRHLLYLHPRWWRGWDVPALHTWRFRSGRRRTLLHLLRLL
jgi:hypothetical protein